MAEYLAVLVNADGQIRVLFPVAEATYVELSDPNTPGDPTPVARLLYDDAAADYADPEDGDDCAVWVLPEDAIEPALLAEYRRGRLEVEVLRCLQYAPWPRFEAMYDWCVAYATTHQDSTTPPAMAAQYAVRAYHEAYNPPGGDAPGEGGGMWQHRLSEDGGEIEELRIEGYHLVVYHDGGEWYLAIRFPDGTSEVTTWTAEDAAKDAGIRVAVAV